MSLEHVAIMPTAEEEHSHWPKMMWKLGQEDAALERQGSCGVSPGSGAEPGSTALICTWHGFSSAPCTGDRNLWNRGQCHFFFFNKGVWERLCELMCWILHTVCAVCYRVNTCTMSSSTRVSHLLTFASCLPQPLHRMKRLSIAS